MTDIATDSGKRKEAPEAGKPDSPRWSKWKPLAAALVMSASAAIPLACSPDNPDTVINIPTQDGGTVDQGDAGPTQADGGMDSGTAPDGGMEADAGTADAGHEDADAGPLDGGPEADAGMDGGPIDSGVDAGPADAGPIDAGPLDGGPADAGPIDSGTDGGVLSDGGASDAGVCGSATTGSWSGFMNNTTPVTVGGYTIRYDGQSGTDALVDLSCSGIADGSSVHCAQGATTNIDVPADHKQIQVHVFSTSPTILSASIVVINH